MGDRRSIRPLMRADIRHHLLAVGETASESEPPVAIEHTRSMLQLHNANIAETAKNADRTWIGTPSPTPGANTTTYTCTCDYGTAATGADCTRNATTGSQEVCVSCNTG